MPIIEPHYTVRFSPANYQLRETRAPDNSYVYWTIVDTHTGAEIGFSMNENSGKQIVLALDYLKAIITGDLSAQKEFMNALAKIRQ